MNKSLVIGNSRVLNLRVILEQFTHFFFPTQFVTVVTFSLAEPIYISKVTEKGKATEKMSDNYGHNIMEGELYFRGNYLQPVRSKKYQISNSRLLKRM